MFIELHQPNGNKIYFNVDQIITVYMDEERRTNIVCGVSTFEVEETVASVMGLIELVTVLRGK